MPIVPLRPTCASRADRKKTAAKHFSPPEQRPELVRVRRVGVWFPEGGGEVCFSRGGRMHYQAQTGAARGDRHSRRGASTSA